MLEKNTCHACPIRFGTTSSQKKLIADLCLTQRSNGDVSRSDKLNIRRKSSKKTGSDARMQERTKKRFSEQSRHDSYSTNPCFKIDFRPRTVKSRRKDVLHDIKAASRTHGERQRLSFTSTKSPPMQKRRMM